MFMFFQTFCRVFFVLEDTFVLLYVFKTFKGVFVGLAWCFFRFFKGESMLPAFWVGLSGILKDDFGV